MADSPSSNKKQLSTPSSKLRHLAWLAHSTRPRDLPLLAVQCFDRLTRSEFLRLYRVAVPYSMCSYPRLRGIYEAVNRAVRQGIPGEIVECGCARGGSAALAGLTLLARRDEARRLWLFDTFEGLPPPTLEDPEFAEAIGLVGQCRGDLEEVQDLFEELSLLDRTTFVKGLFEKTVHTARTGPIAFLHLDGDWFSSVKVCLEAFYDRIAPGGTIQIDDYGHWKGARKAVDEFLTMRNLRPKLRYLDYTGRQWTKE